MRCGRHSVRSAPPLQAERDPIVVQISQVCEPAPVYGVGTRTEKGAPSGWGARDASVQSGALAARPYTAGVPLTNAAEMEGKICLAERCVGNSLTGGGGWAPR